MLRFAEKHVDEIAKTSHLIKEDTQCPLFSEAQQKLFLRK